MGKTYEKAPESCARIVGDVLSHYHTELCDMKLRVDTLLVRASRDADGQPVGPALTGKSGYPAAACISIVKLKDRVKGQGDCEIIIDGDRFQKWSEEVLRALIDHEIEHLEFTGNVDDIGRPKLRLRPHDVEFGWFDAVARRHGDTSFEVTQAKRFFLQRSVRQLYLPGFEDSLPTEDPDAIKPSITRQKAAKELSTTYSQTIAPASLMYVSVPHFAEGESQLVEGWVDTQDRAVIFSKGLIIEITHHLQLSARWAKKDEAS